MIVLQQNYKWTPLSLVYLVLGTLVVSTGFAAEPEGRGDRETRFFYTPPSVEEMAEHLFPKKAASRTRGIVITKQANPEQENKQVGKKSIGLPVLFHFGKTTLVESSKPYLDKVGELMQLPEYSSETLVVEGHTDAAGSDTFNQRLSELRALTVKDYLIKQYDIDPLRLFPDGKGESRLYYPDNPLADENRRVEFLRY